MQYRKSNFDKMIYNPFGENPNDTKVACDVGRLGMALDGIIDIKPSKDIGRIAQYFLFMYDKNTPLRAMHPDVNLRKQEATELAGYDLETEKNKVESLHELSQDKFRTVLINFLKFQNSRDWAELISLEQLHWELNTSILKGYTNFSNDKQEIESKKAKVSVAESVRKISGMIEELENKIFAGDEVAKEAALNIRSGSSPEAFAMNNVYKAPK